MQWATNSGYYIRTSEIDALFGKRVKVLENEVTGAIKALDKTPAYETKPYAPKLEEILNRAKQTGDGNLTPYANELTASDRNVLQLQNP
jgi:hypothetical protein